MRDRLLPTLARLFPDQPPTLGKPHLVERLEQSAPQLQRDAQQMTGDDRSRAQRELQERGRVALQELSLKWLQFAAEPAQSAVAKWVLFLSDVYVVSGRKSPECGLAASTL